MNGVNMICGSLPSNSMSHVCLMNGVNMICGSLPSNSMSHEWCKYDLWFTAINQIVCLMNGVNMICGSFK